MLVQSQDVGLSGAGSFRAFSIPYNVLILYKRYIVVLQLASSGIFLPFISDMPLLKIWTWEWAIYFSGSQLV